MPKIKLKEGTILLVPINGMFAAGLITRVRSRSVPLGFFFDKLYHAVEDFKQLDISIDNLALVSQFGTQGLSDGTWKTIGFLEGFERSLWPVPIFFLKRDIGGNCLIHYDDNMENDYWENLSQMRDEFIFYPESGLRGSGSLEYVLGQVLLSNNTRKTLLIPSRYQEETRTNQKQ